MDYMRALVKSKFINKTAAGLMPSLKSTKCTRLNREGINEDDLHLPPAGRY